MSRQVLTTVPPSDVQAPGRIYLVLEFCAGGDVSDYIKKHRHIPEPTVCYFMRQLAAGLEHLRRHHLVHVCSPKHMDMDACSRPQSLTPTDNTRTHFPTA